MSLLFADGIWYVRFVPLMLPNTFSNVLVGQVGL